MLGKKQKILFVTLIFILSVVTICWIILLVKVVIIQLIEGEKWKEKSEKQQFVSREITANRGTIFDSSGEIILKTIKKK